MYRYITQFSTYLQQQRVSHHTLQAYVHDLQQLATYIMHNGIYDIYDITQEHITDFLYHIESLGVTRSTAHRKCASLRHFFQFYALSLDAPYPTNTLGIFCHDDTVIGIYQHLTSQNDPYVYRDATLIWLIYKYEIPFDTLAPLRIKHAARTANHVTVSGIHTSAAITQYYDMYMPRLHRKTTMDTQLLFPYLRRQEAIIMPYQVFMQRLRAYISSYRRPSDTQKFVSGACESADATIKRQYDTYHGRA